jgi:type 1 glutamine amidotransferase
MRGWSRRTTRADEWYGFHANPRPSVHVLASLEESSYDTSGGDMGPGNADHPIAWCRRYRGGRSVYTGMGHPAKVWRDKLFLRHIFGSIQMAAGRARFACKP